MEDAPITFEFEEKTYNGRFEKVEKAGGSTAWDLMDDKNFYLGRLRLVNSRWFFDNTPKTVGMEKLAEYFGSYITAWYE